MLPHSYPHHWKTSTSRCILESKKPLNLPAWFEKKPTQSTSYSLPIDQQYKFDLGIIQSNCLIQENWAKWNMILFNCIFFVLFAIKNKEIVHKRWTLWSHFQAICQNKFHYMMNRKTLNKEPHYSPTKLFLEAKINSLNPY